MTGGAHGIGRALAEELTDRGARVVVADLNVERAQRVAARIGGLAVVCDVASPDDITALVAQAEDAFGRVSVFCSNTGYSDTGDGLTQTSEQLRHIVDVNLLSHVWAAQRCCRACSNAGRGGWSRRFRRRR
nr:SDR family oxidoreductase [Mycobacterium sp. E3247]